MAQIHELILNGTCISKQEADAKVNGFREWLAELPAEDAAVVEDMRERYGRIAFWQFGPRAVDELVVSLILKVGRR